MKYYLNEIMTISEASDLYGIKIETLKSKLKSSIVGQEKMDYYLNNNLIRKSNNTWLLTKDFIELIK